MVRLTIEPADRHGPAAVRQWHDGTRPLSDALVYVVNAILGRRHLVDWIALLERKEDLPLPDGLASSPVRDHFDEYEHLATNWEALTGNRPDLRDCYFVGTTFTADNLVIPRAAFIDLIKQMSALDASVQAGEIEARIDESMPVPLPLAPSKDATKPWNDSEWQELEEKARQLDVNDPLTDELADPERSVLIARQRGELFDWLEVAWLRTSRGKDDMPARCRELGLSTLLAYDAATDAMLAYLHDPERISIVGTPVPATPYRGEVSVDVFRLPVPAHPPEMTFHAWLARCEAVFIRERGGPEKGAGDLFTRIVGHRVRLRYRLESPDHLMLWRVELV
ncbi:MAG: hypothetical protein F9K40_00030 [Kofleriaceae bacterium]|nr:MAG: hypothetical protein F9K40_00030 [Kofleriaceae bacterium]MBZ0231757.1 hypothetical protein [Kofleriaceae bacterium]